MYTIHVLENVHNSWRNLLLYFCWSLSLIVIILCWFCDRV